MNVGREESERLIPRNCPTCQDGLFSPRLPVCRNWNSTARTSGLQATPAKNIPAEGRIENRQRPARPLQVALESSRYKSQHPHFFRRNCPMSAEARIAELKLALPDAPK